MDANFFKILEALADQDVEFVVVGGVAANFHGSALSTFDCDVAVDLNSENLSKLAKALSSLFPTFRHKTPPQVFDEAAAEKGGWKNIYLDTSAGVLDCLGDIKGLGGFAECKARSLEVDLGGFTIRVLTRDALIEAKKAMGRPKDLLTVAQLEVGSELEGK
ncbi:MAG: hypothetical protein ABJQ29_00355 [Luteolibacter sp.]